MFFRFFKFKHLTRISTCDINVGVNRDIGLYQWTRGALIFSRNWCLPTGGEGDGAQPGAVSAFVKTRLVLYQ